MDKYIELLAPELNEIILSLLPTKLKRLLSKYYFQSMSNCKLRNMRTFICSLSMEMMITKNIISLEHPNTINKDYFDSNTPPAIYIIGILISQKSYRFHARNIKGLISDVKTLKEIFQIAEVHKLLLSFS